MTDMIGQWMYSKPLLEKVFIDDNKMLEIINGLLIKFGPFVWGLDRRVQVELIPFFLYLGNFFLKLSHLLMQNFK